MTDHERRQTASRNGRQGGNITKRKSKRIWIFALLFLFVVSALILSGWMRTPSSVDTGSTGGTFTVREDDLIITVTESGNIQAQESTDIMCEVEGRGVEIASIVSEGTVITQEDVTNGKILCQLNAAELQDTYNREQIQYSTAKASYSEAQEAYTIQKKQNESDIAAAELAVEFGLMDLQNYLGESTAQQLIEQVVRDPNAPVETKALSALLDDPNNLGGEASQMHKQYQNDILLAEGLHEKATDVLTGTQKLHDANYASDLDLKSAQLDVNRFRIQQESSTEALRLYKLYSFPKQTKQLISDYHEAQRELDRTIAQTRSQLAQAQAKLESSEASFNLQKSHVAKLERQIAACVIRAPSPGILVYGSSADWYSRRDDPIEVGDMVRRGQKIFTIPNSNVMSVELRVHESSVNKVLPDQDVTITVEAYPDQEFHGKVVKVAPLPDPQHGWLDPGVKLYTTHVRIEGSHDILKPGMSAKVEILVERLHDVKIVPVHVVANRSGKKLCYVAADSGPLEREVQTGAFNDTFVEIVSGLQVGEKVLLSPPRPVERENSFDSKQPRQSSPEEKKPQDGVEKDSKSLEEPKPDSGSSTT
ncbi:efflux RND transporter periplasmic adaptor subunit [Planctomycetota bacterium]